MRVAVAALFQHPDVFDFAVFASQACDELWQGFSHLRELAVGGIRSCARQRDESVWLSGADSSD